eukprot:3909895-Prymnesium_polylepis.1
MVHELDQTAVDHGLNEFATVLLGVKCCSHPLLLHAGASARRARSHPEFGAQNENAVSHSQTRRNPRKSLEVDRQVTFLQTR